MISVLDAKSAQRPLAHEEAGSMGPAGAAAAHEVPREFAAAGTITMEDLASFSQATLTTAGSPPEVTARQCQCDASNCTWS